MTFNEHKYMLFLDRKLYTAAIKLQADRGLGHSFSAMLPFVEGMYQLGYLAKEDYEVYKAKYSVSLEDDANRPSLTEIRLRESKEQKYRQLNNHYKLVIEQWDSLKVDAKYYHVKDAKKNSNLKYAKKLIELAEQETLVNEV